MPHRGAARASVEASVRGREALARRDALPHIVPLQADIDSAQEHESRAASPGACAQQDEGLLHDVRNLVSAVGLYCDLLSMPHVLRPEHRHYADELRLLGERSAALIERLMEAGGRLDHTSAAVPPPPSPLQERRAMQPIAGPAVEEQTRFEGLRPMVERCTGLLRSVAAGRAIAITYGDAAALQVRVAAEPVERILVNLVRNAAAALQGRRGGIRINVGVLPGITGEVRPWPFQRVRLVVEDDGCGMSAAQVEHLLCGEVHSSHHHGIGFRVVRELVAFSGGELVVVGHPGQGTRIEIAWPVVTAQMDSHPGAPGLPISDGERRRVQ